MTAATGSAMEEFGPSFKALFVYNESETARWRRWFEANPQALEVKVGSAADQTVRDLVRHIFEAELFLTSYMLSEERPRNTSAALAVDEIFALHEQASERAQRFMESMTVETLTDKVELRFKPDFHVSRRKLLTQYFLHGVHHWAQIALLVRQAGFPSDGPHDYILSAEVV